MLILVTYVFIVQNCMLIPKNKVVFIGHLKVFFPPLEVMTPRSHLFIYSNTYLISRVTNQNDRNCLGNIIKFEKKMKYMKPHKSHFLPAR